jgi:uncharacterized tellurite resistance protein B-like protein
MPVRLSQEHVRDVQNFKDWISRRLGLATDAADPGSPADALHLAVAALLVEVLRADYHVGAAERHAVIEAAESLLGLSGADSHALVEEAEREIDKSHDLYQFTSRDQPVVLRRREAALLEQLWRVAHADDNVHKYEEHLIRRVADLLHVPHSAFIASKLRARP